MAPEEIFFEWATPMRVGTFYASAICTLLFFCQVRLLGRCVFDRGSIRSRQRRLISQEAACCEEGSAGC